jgi:cyanuric acid amidohydrolase
LTSDRIEAASARGNKTVTNSAYGSMAYSRGVIVLGNSAPSASPFEIGHTVMRDAIDSAAVIDALKSAGLRAEDGSEPASGRQLVNIFAKAA